MSPTNTQGHSDTPAVSVVYDSRGSLLVVGPARRIRSVLQHLPAVFRTLLVTCDRDDVVIPSGVRADLVQAQVVQLRGHLGRFRAGIAGPDGLLDLGPLSPNRDGLFDLVLDLGDEPLISNEVPALGYAHSTDDAVKTHEALERLSRLIGPVNKPRYFSFDERLCAHDYQGRQGCSRCLSSCPAGAIGSVDHAITIDPYLCRGCGSCTLVCPTGAVRYARPKPKVTLEAIARMLEEALAGGNALPVLAFHAGDPAKAEIPAEVLTVPVPAVGAVGSELWLSALALGASRVLIVRSGLLPPTTARLLSEQVAVVRTLLQAIGEVPERIRIVDEPNKVDWDGLDRPWPPMAADQLRSSTGKRAQQILALTHLAEHARGASRPVALEQTDPFATLRIDQKACTLCHACVGACPTAALRNVQGALSFVERDCVQCGLCTGTCPERALRLIPQFDPETSLAGTERVLKPASEMFCCVACGKPFATVSLVEGSMRHVRDHPMFRGDGARLLQMCMECRQKASVEMA